MSSTNSSAERKKITTHTYRMKKKRGEIITMLTAYDYGTALAVDRTGIDSILVGDSLGMVVLGYENTLPVTMNDMIHHCKAVARGAKYALLIGDMPFMSYQASVEDAVRNAGRFATEAGAQIIKIDSVWAGHPVGFSLLTKGKRQYIAYYNTNRNMVVGQRNLTEDSFSLHTLQATFRETSGGTSTVLGWDSHIF